MTRAVHCCVAALETLVLRFIRNLHSRRWVRVGTHFELLSVMTLILELQHVMSFDHFVCAACILELLLRLDQFVCGV